MALDSNQPAVGSWGLGPLGTPLGAPTASTTPLAVPSTLTPDQVALMRQHAMALQTPPEGGIHHWTQGLAELVRAIQGNREADFARQAEATGRQHGAEAISSLYKPYLSQGGDSPSAAGPAPVGQRESSPAGATPSSDDQSSPTPPAAITADNSHDPRGMEPYIRETATKYGVDPDTAVKVAKAEGLRDFYGDGGKSGGAFQLYTGGGMGNDFQKATGLDPLDPKNEKATIDYALKNVPRVGWTPFHGARKVGIGEREGILTQPKTAAAPTGLFSQPPGPMAYANEDAAPAGLPPEIAQGASVPRATPPMAAPAPAAPNMAPMVNAIAGRPLPPISASGTPPGPLPAPGAPISPTDFARAAAAMEAAKGGPSVPLPSTPINQGIQPTDFAKAAAAMEAAKGPPVPLPSGPIPPGIPPDQFARAAAAIEATRSAPPAAAAPAAQAPAAAAAPSPVPMPVPRPTMPLPAGSAVPGAVGPTSVGGAPLVAPRPPLAIPPPFGSTSVNGAPLPQAGGIPPATLVSAIAGRPMAPAPTAPVAPAAGGGAPNPMAPIQVAQNGPPTGGPPMGAGGPSGLPQPLTSSIGQINPAQLTQMLANPWVPESAKAAMLQMIQQRAQPQSMPVEGGTLMFDAAGRKVFIPEPKFGTVKVGTAEIPTVSHFDPATRQWNTTTLAPGGGVQTSAAPPAGSVSAGGGGALPPTGNAAGALPHPAISQPDLSTIGGIQAAEAAQAGAKKAAETGGEATAKYYDSLHKGLAGSAMIAAQQKQNIDMLRQVAAAPDFTPGSGSEAALGLQRLAAQFGINPEGAAPREIFNQVATRILSDQISGIKSMASETGETGGRIFKSMLDLEEKANITPEDTAAGINAKINLIDNAGNLMMKWGDMADDYVAKHGKLDPGFDKELRKEISAARIPNVVPKAEGEAPISKEINGKTYYMINGKVYDNPEGK